MMSNRNPVFYLRFDKDSGKLTYKDGETKRSFDCVEGWLREIRREKWQPAGAEKPRHSLVLVLVDRSVNEEYRLSTSYYGGPARSILNQIASIENDLYNDILLSSGKKGEYTSVYMQKDGKRLEWKYKPEEIPKSEEIKIKETGETFISNVKKDAFFDKLFEELSGKINFQAKPSIPNPLYQRDPDYREEPVNDEPGNDEPAGDDLPF